MSDPFSIAAGVVGITGVALHGTRRLQEDLQQLKDAPETVKRLKEDVNSVEIALKSIQAVEKSEWEMLGADVVELSRTTISNCTQACEVFRIDLQRWTKHSEEGKLTWRDGARVGFFKQGQIKAMSQQLANFKLTINNVVNIATLYSSVRHSHITEDIRKMMSTKQAELDSAIINTDKQLVVVETQIQELKSSSDQDIPAESGESEIEALRRQLEEELSSVKASLKLLNELLSKSQEEAVAKAAKNQHPSNTVTFGNQNSGFQAGVLYGGVSGLHFGGK